MKSIWNQLLHFLQRAAQPVRKEYWLFFSIFAMLLQQPIEWLCYPSTDAIWQMLKFLQGAVMLMGVCYIATLIVYFSKRKWVKWLVYAFFWMLMSIDIFLVMSFNMGISQQALTVLVETNPSESSEFVSTYMLCDLAYIIYGICLAVAIVVALGEWQRENIRHFLSKYLNRRFLEYAVSTLSLAGVVLLAIAYSTLAFCNNSQKVYHWRTYFPPESMEPFSQSLHAINSLRAFDNDVKFALAQVDEVMKTHPTVEEIDSLTVIYVLGESYNKHHASLYGYYLPTTPCMEQEQRAGRLFAFTDAVAQENVTSVVEKNSFCLNSVGDGEAWFDSPNFTTIFHRAGYDVWMWDMQRTWNSAKLFTITVNSFVYNDKIIKTSYTACNATRFALDEQLLSDFNSKVHFSKPHNFVFFHLMGQHVSYIGRYPSQFAKFTARDIPDDRSWLTKEKKKTIAEYDNATYYNDYVMGQIFKRFMNENAVLVYMGDHGEEIYDWRDHKGRQSDHIPPPGMLRNQNEVPFIVWCSPRYEQLHPETVKQLQAAIDRPIMTDLVGQLLLDLGRIKTEYYRPERDYISPEFTPRKRMLFDYRVNYDEAMRSEK